MRRLFEDAGLLCVMLFVWLVLVVGRYACPRRGEAINKLLLLLLLLLPSLVWADQITVKKAEKIDQPIGTIDRVSLRTRNGLVFEKDSIGSGIRLLIASLEPLCYDSAGALKKIDLTERAAKTLGYEKRVNVGLSSFEYDSTGRLRYEKGGLSFEVNPAFSPKQVAVKFEFTNTQLKATYTISDNASRHLAWSVKDADGIAQRKVLPFASTDADGKPVTTTTEWTADSLFADVTGGKLPITVDPTIQDTIVSARTYFMYTDKVGATWLANRDSTTAGSNTGNNAWEVGRYLSTNMRTAIIFSLTEYNIAGVKIDSTRFYIYTDALYPAQDSVMVHAVLGNFTGVSNGAWYNDFYGWAASGAYSPTYLTATRLNFKTNVSAQWQSSLFTSAGNDTVGIKFRSDSLRVMLLSTIDISGDSTQWGVYAVERRTFTVTGKPYLAIYYHSTQPSVSSTADTLKAAATLVANLDSIGGSYPTVRGFKLWPKGGVLAGDTITISGSGYFDVGSYSTYVDSLLLDTLYRWKPFATNLTGTSYGALDSFSTTLAGGGTTTIYDTTFIRRGGFGGKFRR